MSGLLSITLLRLRFCFQPGQMTKELEKQLQHQQVPQVSITRLMCIQSTPIGSSSSMESTWESQDCILTWLSSPCFSTTHWLTSSLWFHGLLMSGILLPLTFLTPVELLAKLRPISSQLAWSVLHFSPILILPRDPGIFSTWFHSLPLVFSSSPLALLTLQSSILSVVGKVLLSSWMDLATGPVNPWLHSDIFVKC